MADGRAGRSSALDLLRGMAILIVVIGHAIQVNLPQGHTSFIRSYLIMPVQMPLLFFISGYTTGFSFPSKNPGLFIRKKAVRLLLPYLSWESLHYFIAAALPGDYRRLGLAEFLREILVSDFWFLRMLFLFFVITWLADILLHLLHQEKNAWASIIALLVLSPAVMLAERMPLLSQSADLWYYQWFVCGYAAIHVLRDERVRKLWRIRRLRRVAVGVGLAAMAATAVILTQRTIRPRLVCVIFCFGICIAACGLERVIPTLIRDFGTKIGQNTLPVYAIHWCLLFSPLMRIQFYTGLFSGWPLPISSALTAAAWTLICVLLTRLLRRTRLTRVLLLGEA